MNKFASREIDFHDSHSLLVNIGEDLPDFVKKASPDQSADIPLERWAVVLVTPEKAFAKFALHNQAFTWIASRLLPKTASHLPLRAQQIAAHNVRNACREYRMEYPAEIDRLADCSEKVAGNVLDLMEYQDETQLDYDQYKVGWRGEIQKDHLKEKLKEFADREEGSMASSQGMGEELASRIYSYAMAEGFSLPPVESLASLAASALPEGAEKSEVKKFFIDRVNQVEAGEKIKRASVTVQLHNYQEETFGILAKTAEGQTLGRFPMHTPELVKQAQEFFLDNLPTMKPSARKDLANGIVKNASAHGLFVEDPRIRNYGGDDFSPNVHANVLARLPFIKGAEEDVEKAQDTLKNLLSLQARGGIHAEKFASTLEEFDKRCGLDQAWDSHIKDPYLSTFESTKQAGWSYRMGEDVITEDQLRTFFKKHVRELDGYLQQHLISEMQRDPTNIFDSLPRPEKEIIIYKMQEVGVAG